MKKSMLIDDEFQSAIRRGMAEQVNALKVDYGIGHVKKTADFVIQEVGLIEVDDPTEAFGAELIRDVASTVATKVGDGSTTAAVLSEAICSGALDLIGEGADPNELVRGIEIGVKLVCRNLEKAAKPLVKSSQLKTYGKFCVGDDFPSIRVAAGGKKFETEPVDIGGVVVVDLQMPKFQREEILERADRLARMAREGAVPGGGVELCRAAMAINTSGHHWRDPAVRAGIELVRRACREPMRNIAVNFDRDPRQIQRMISVANPDSGFDARAGHLVRGEELAILDPLVVVESAISEAGTHSAELLKSVVEKSLSSRKRIERPISWIAGPSTGRILLSTPKMETPVSGGEIPSLDVAIPSEAKADSREAQPIAAKGRRSRTVSTGLSELDSPGEPLDASVPLLPGTEYFFWMEIGEPVAGSIEQTPTEIGPLPAGSRLRVVVFGFRNEIELFRGEESGDFLQTAEGTITVQRQPASNDRLHAPDEIVKCRMFFPVRTPAKDGEFRFRCHIYHEQTLLQARCVHVRVSSVPVAIDQALVSVLDYNLCSSLVPSKLGRDQRHQPALNVLLNEGPNGSHTLRFCSGKYTASAHFDGEDLIQLIGRIRMALNEVSWGKPEPWQEGWDYLYRSGKKLAPLTKDLAKLAEAGAQIYAAIADKLPGDDLTMEEMEKLLAAGTTIEIEHRESARVYLPAGMIYDYIFDIASDWKLCPDFAKAFSGDAPLWTSPCFVNGCRQRSANVLCPSGFWGYRHELGFPLSLPKGMDARNSIVLGQNKEMFAAVALDLAGVDKHLDALRKEGWQPARLDSRKAVKDKLLENFNGSPAVIYFYCHGGVDQYGVPFLRVGKTKEEPFKYGFVKGYKWEPPRPLVMLNGCRTAAVLPDKAMDLVTQFVRLAHAAGVIGTEITIFESLAQRFAECFLDELLKGSTLGAAIRHSRLVLLRDGNPLGLAYVPFAMHDLHLVTSDQKPLQRTA
jgi:hypothetical protein